MKQDQNRIELRLNTAEYDECTLYANSETRILPGSLLVFMDGNVSNSTNPVRSNRGYASFDYEPRLRARVYSSTSVVDGYMMNQETGVIDGDNNWGPYTRYQFKVEESDSEADILEAYVDAFDENDTPSIDLLKQKFAVPGSIDRFPCAVVLENGLYGKSLCHAQYAGDRVLCRYLSESNEVLVRAVPGTYYYGDEVYAVQTKTNGIWVASAGTLSQGVSSGILDTGASLGMRLGICQEDYRITPAMCFIIDNTDPEEPTGYTSADKDVDPLYIPRYGASAVPEKLFGIDGFYNSSITSSRYFAGAMLNLIKVRTTAFYASTTVLPAIDGVDLPDSVTKRYKGSTWNLDELLPVNVDGAEVSRDVVGGNEIRNRGDYTVVVTVRKEGFRPLTKRVSVTILPQPLVVNVEDGNPEWTRAADNTTNPIKLDLTAYTTGIIPGEDITVYGTTGNLPGSAAGTYTEVQLYFTHTGSEQNNYYIVHENPWPKVTVVLTGSPNPTGSDDPPEGLSVGYSSLGDTITYDGVDRPISDFFVFEGTEDGDDINYYVDGTLFGGEVPTVKAPGAYSVTITVDREGYAQFSETLPVTINKAPVTVSGTVVADKVYDGTTDAVVTPTTITGRVSGEDVNIVASGSFASKVPGTHDVTVTYNMVGSDAGNYVFSWDTEIKQATITPKQLMIPRPMAFDKTYDGTTTASIEPSSLIGLVSGDEVTVAYDCAFETPNAGTQLAVNVSYRLGGADAGCYLAPADDTALADINKVALSVSGTTVEDKDYDETTDATVVLGTVSGVVGEDDVVVTPSASFPSADPGTYTVRISYTLSGATSGNYEAPSNNTVRATIRQVEVAPAYTYAAVANGGPTETTTEIAVHFTASDPSTIPTSIPYSNIQIGGDADLNTDAEECVGSLGIFAIPVRMKKGAKDSYEITIKIDAGNEDINVKPVTAYFMSGYWGCYPCQLGDSTTPTADQITGMYGRNVLTGAKVGSVSCTFALDERDWSIEVQKNEITGEDADMEESGCGYEFFVTCWDDTTIGTIMNESNIPQNAAFKPFTITINGIEYSGVVSKNCDLPSGTSPYTVNLT